MNKKQRFAIYMLADFAILGWKHSLLWGLALGVAVGFLIGMIVFI